MLKGQEYHHKLNNKAFPVGNIFGERDIGEKFLCPILDHLDLQGNIASQTFKYLEVQVYGCQL